MLSTVRKCIYPLFLLWIEILLVVMLATNQKERQRQGDRETERERAHKTDFSSKYPEEALSNFLRFSHNLNRYRNKLIRSEKSDRWLLVSGHVSTQALPQSTRWNLRTLMARSSDQCKVCDGWCQGRKLWVKPRPPCNAISEVSDLSGEYSSGCGNNIPSVHFQIGRQESV